MNNEMPGMKDLENAMGEMETPAASPKNEICFPASVLAEGENRDVMPESGESVTVPVTGKIRIEGDKAYLAAEQVDGEPVMGAEKEAPAAEDSEESLRGLSEEMDREEA